MKSKFLIVGGDTGLSPVLEKKLGECGHDVRRVNWEAPRSSFFFLEKAIDEKIQKLDKYVLIVVSHLKSFYPQFFFYLLNLPKTRQPLKTIMLGSTTSDKTKTSLDVYNVEKKILAELVLQIQQDESSPPITLIRPGAIDTDRVRHLHGGKMSTEQFSDALIKLFELEDMVGIDLLNVKFIKKFSRPGIFDTD